MRGHSKKQSTCIAYPNLLFIHRVLWVEWKDRYLRLGYGHTIGVDEFFSKYFENTAINAVRFISTDHVNSVTGSQAYFTFRYLQGMSTKREQSY